MLFYMYLSIMLFFTGSMGMFLFSKNIMNMLISLELILLSMNFNFMVFSCFLDDLLGQLYALFILTLAAAESSMGLAMIVIYYRLRGGISIDLMSLLKG